MGDVPALAAIERACFGREGADDLLAAELTRSWARVRVAELPGEGLAAFVDGWLVADEFEVHFVATRPERQRRGLGALLLDHLLAEVAAEGATAALLEVRRDNAAAQALYRTRSFEVVAERRGYYDDGEDALVMRCGLGRFLGGPGAGGLR
ncbi:MAG: rimI [Myxococcaceae bacterium]|nr:rimI [Myxococcaceae bacterium]